MGQHEPLLCEEPTPTTGDDHATLDSQTTDIDTCGGISAEDLGRLNAFIITTKGEIKNWNRWRSFQAINTLDTIPSARALERAYEAFKTHAPLSCNLDPCQGFSLSSPEVRDVINSHISSEELDLLTEWVSFIQQGDRPNQEFIDFWGLHPADKVTHEYTLVLGLGQSMSFDLKSPLSFLYDERDVAIGYSNDYNESTWAAMYRMEQSGLSGGLAFGATAAMSGSRPTELLAKNLCQGKIEGLEDGQVYKPDDFLGEFGFYDLMTGVDLGFIATMSFGQSFTSRVAINPRVGAAERLLSGRFDEFLVFDMSGQCHEVGVGGGAAISIVEAELALGDILHWQEFETSVVPPPHVPTTPEVDEPSYSYRPGPSERLISRSFYFKTSGDDPLNDPLYGGLNQQAMNEIIDALDMAHIQTPVREVDVHLVGHASPAWRDAEDEHEAAALNEELAGQRVTNSEEMIRNAYRRLGEGFPPISEALNFSCEMCADLEGPACSDADVETLDAPGRDNMGSSVGFAETGDPNSDYVMYRRVDIEVSISTLERIRELEPRACDQP